MRANTSFNAKRAATNLSPTLSLGYSTTDKGRPACSGDAQCVQNNTLRHFTAATLINWNWISNSHWSLQCSSYFSKVTTHFSQLFHKQLQWSTLFHKIKSTCIALVFWKPHAKIFHWCTSCELRVYFIILIIVQSIAVIMQAFPALA